MTRVGSGAGVLVLASIGAYLTVPAARAEK
jgi:hypothetical protein